MFSFSYCGETTLLGLRPPYCLGFEDTHHSRTRLDEGSARRRDLYQTAYNTHNRHPCPWQDSYPQSQQTIGRRPTP
jgi:hypothetical protein